MSQQELLIQVVRILDELGIDYMVTGSFASSMQGEPRLTHDVDLVGSLTADECDKLVQAFSSSDD